MLNIALFVEKLQKENQRYSIKDISNNFEEIKNILKIPIIKQ